MAWTIDTAHTTVSFSARHMGLAKVRGIFSRFEGAIEGDPKDITSATGRFEVDLASVDTGNEDRDAHLRSADFFDVEKYPDITFQSKHVEKKGKDFVAHGTFTMHGVSKEIALPFTLNGVQPAKDGKTVLGVTARTTINRKDFGVSFARPDNPNFLGDNVEIELSLVTRAAAPAGAAPAPAPSGK